MFAGAVFYHGDAADDVLRGFRDACAGAGDGLTTVLNLTTAPPAPFLPEAVHGKPVVAVLGMWSGALDDGDAATSPFRHLAEPIVDLFGPMPYRTMQSLIDPLYPRGLHNYFNSAFIPALDDGVCRSLTAAYRQAPNALSELHIHHLGGAMGRVPSDATAFATRDQDFIVNVIARTPTAEHFDAGDQTGPAPSRARSDRVRPMSTSPVRAARIGCAPPTRPRPTNGWSRSRTGTTRTTCSVSTRTFSRPPRNSGVAAEWPIDRLTTPRPPDDPQAMRAPIARSRKG